MSKENAYMEVNKILKGENVPFPLRTLIYLKAREYETKYHKPIYIDDDKALEELRPRPLISLPQIRTALISMGESHTWGERAFIKGQKVVFTRHFLEENPEFEKEISYNGDIMIYAFRIKNSPQVKVGQTKQNMRTRLRGIIRMSDIPADLVEIIMIEPNHKGDGKTITDTDVHMALAEMGCQRLTGGHREWFIATDEQVKEAYHQALFDREYYGK